MISDILIFYVILLQNNLFSRVIHIYFLFYIYIITVLYFYYLLHWDLHITLCLHYYYTVLFITLSIFYDITITHTLLHYYDTIQYLLHYYISYIIIHFLHSLILFFCYLVHLDLGNSHLLCLCHQNQGFCRYLCPGYLCPGIHHLVLATGKLSLLLDHHHSCFAYCRCYLVVFGYG